jgi:hemerythrin-like domain-containing protein
MEDVFDVLAEDHEEIRQALAELEKGPTAATGATEDQLMLRKIMTEELIIEVSKHEEIELTWLWPAVREHVSAGEQLADRGICAELEIAALLTQLDKLDASQPEFEDLLSLFTQVGREHFDFEERQAWPRLRLALAPLAPRAAAELGGKILLARQSLAARPGPHAPAPSQSPPWSGESARHGSFG